MKNKKVKERMALTHVLVLVLLSILVSNGMSSTPPMHGGGDRTNWNSIALYNVNLLHVNDEGDVDALWGEIEEDTSTLQAVTEMSDDLQNEYLLTRNPSRGSLSYAPNHHTLNSICGPEQRGSQPARRSFLYLAQVVLPAPSETTSVRRVRLSAQFYVTAVTNRGSMLEQMDKPVGSVMLHVEYLSSTASKDQTAPEGPLPLSVTEEHLRQWKQIQTMHSNLRPHLLFSTQEYLFPIDEKLIRQPSLERVSDFLVPPTAVAAYVYLHFGGTELDRVCIDDVSLVVTHPPGPLEQEVSLALHPRNLLTTRQIENHLLWKKGHERFLSVATVHTETPAVSPFPMNSEYTTILYDRFRHTEERERKKMEDAATAAGQGAAALPPPHYEIRMHWSMSTNHTAILTPETRTAMHPCHEVLFGGLFTVIGSAASITLRLRLFRANWVEYGTYTVEAHDIRDAASLDAKTDPPPPERGRVQSFSSVLTTHWFHRTVQIPVESVIDTMQLTFFLSNPTNGSWVRVEAPYIMCLKKQEAEEVLSRSDQMPSEFHNADDLNDIVSKSQLGVPVHFASRIPYQEYDTQARQKVQLWYTTMMVTATILIGTLGLEWYLVRKKSPAFSEDSISTTSSVLQDSEDDWS